MNTSRVLPRLIAVALLAAAAVVALQDTAAAGQQRQLIVDLLTTPQKFWNTTVVVRGHVRSVTANPPGTNRGTYVFRDSSDSDITIATGELPPIGQEFSVTGVVTQETPDATVPFLREVSRSSGATAPPPAPRATAPPREPARAAASTAAATPAPVTAAPAPVLPAPAAVPAEPGMSRLAMYALVGVVAVLSLVVIVAFWPRRPVAASSRGYVDVGPVVLPASRQAPSPILPPSAAPAGGAPTRYVPPAAQAPAAAAATTLFMDLGADLVVTEGADAGNTFQLTKPRITIGRAGGRQNDVTLADSSASREHAKIVFNQADQSFRFFNESSTNPARINGTVVESALLKHNDRIQLGATSMTFVKRPAGPKA